MTEKKYTNEELKAALEKEIMNDAELDNVAGGTYGESWADMEYLNQYCGVGFNPNDREWSVKKLGELYRRAGMKLEAHNSEDHFNVYRDSRGYIIDRNTALYKLGCKINAGEIDTFVR